MAAMESKSTSTRKSGPPIRETIIYPQIKHVTDENNSCLNPNMASEHVLYCGHLINTVAPNEPCAPNCHHIFTKHGPGIMMLKSASIECPISGKDFYCDACVETEFEARIRTDVTSEAAEDKRAILRVEEAKRRGKETKFRKCYIADKRTSVPCRVDGSVSPRYVPDSKSHPWDTAIPRTGRNWFEDIDVQEAEKEKEKEKEKETEKEEE